MVPLGLYLIPRLEGISHFFRFSGKPFELLKGKNGFNKAREAGLSLAPGLIPWCACS
jgi:hypothetical protein